MAEEFQESEVIFHEKEKPTNQEDCYSHCYTQQNQAGNEKLGRKKKRNSISVPMNIPVEKNSWFQYVETELMGDDDGEMVPPHEILEQRIAGKMAFSVCTGNGRTLKGRDLSEVRNSILRMTGFLET